MIENGQPVDAQARQRALDPAGSFIVQAPAGSGKTELLIQRILALLAGVRSPEEVLAITFTRKAAGEMRTRLLDTLKAARDTTPPADAHARTTWGLACQALERDEELGWDLAGNPSRLNIMTIDSLCASLTRRMPWMSGFGSQPQVTEDASELYRRAAERLLQRIEHGGEGSRQARDLLRHVDNRLATLRDMLTDMLARRDQWLRHLLGHGPEARDVLEAGLTAYIEASLKVASQSIDESLQDELCALIAYACDNLGEGPLVDAWAGRSCFAEPAAADWPAWQALVDLLLTGSDKVRSSVNRNQGFPPGDERCAQMKARMLKVLEAVAVDDRLHKALLQLRNLPRDRYLDGQWSVLESLITLLPLAVLSLQLVFAESGQVDFVEVAGAARAALGSSGRPEDLLLQLDSSISHILVDEFQDTSFGQYQLLDLLTGGWQAGDGRTLFVVGDPMQSIYRFREAEVGLYLKARRTGLANVPLEPLTLEANFRSQAGIVDWVNATFSTLFPNLPDESRGAVPYAAASAVHGRLPGSAVSFTTWEEKHDRDEAQQLVAKVEEILAGDESGTVAILVRSRGHLAEIVRELKGYGLRYQAQEIDPLTDRPVVQDLRSLTRALLHLDDRIAWLAVLRAPWCGLRLDDLLDLCEPSAAATVWELLQQPEAQGQLFVGHDDECGRRLARIRTVMGQSLNLRGRVSLRRLVESTWLKLGGPACIDQVGLEDAHQVFRLIEQLEEGGDLPRLETFDDQLAKLFAAPDSEAPPRLQLMTIHKAKGLEFDTVLLPGLGKSVRGSGRDLLRWQELTDDHLLLAPVPAFDGRDVDQTYKSIGTLLRDKDDLETLRLFYVAATRAKKRLHLFAHARLLDSGTYSPAHGSLLAAAWSVLDEWFEQSLCVTASLEDCTQTYSQQLRRLPAEWSLPMFPAPFRRSNLKSGKVIDRPDQSDRSFTLRTELGRHIGTVTHQLLERVAQEGTATWTPERLNTMKPAIVDALTSTGIALAQTPDAAERVVAALRTTLGSSRGQWILADHESAENELALTGFVDGELVDVFVDRTFLCEGTRWIIDYKTSQPGNGSLDVFLRNELENYRLQLELYMSMFRAMDPDIPVRAALYFPVLDEWAELNS